MKQLTRLLLILTAAGLYAAGAGEKEFDEREIAGTTEVRLTTVGTLHLRQGEPERLEIDADPADLKRISAETRGGRLTIRYRGRRFGLMRGPIDYYLTVRDLDSVMTTSSGDIAVEGFRTRELELASDSSGDIWVDALEAEFLDVRLSSSGDLTIDDGRVTSQRIRCSSSGDYRAEALESETAEVTLTSSGNAWISVSQRLTARLSSSGDLHLFGEPTVDALTISSSGELKRE